MALPNQFAASASVMGSDLTYHDEGIDGVDALQAQHRYAEERAKRLRDEGYQQYIEPSLTDEFQHFHDDPWVNSSKINDIEGMFPDSRCRFLILGGGFAGILYAIRLVKAGFDAQDIRIVDTAGGFGGTWYWNRYPGLMCDIESYTYLPLLEETGYVPRHRYAYGEEIREYANLLANQWKLVDSAVFQAKGQRFQWDEPRKEWKVELLQKRMNQQPKTLHIRCQFIALANGPLNWPKLPELPGILEFKGETFHSSRWNYEKTGGSAENPQLTKLRDKRVAIIGTGATAVQIIPELARYAKHLYVVQRTPSAVDHRDQRKTDADWFHKVVASKPGWQRERMRNFHAHFTLEKQPDVNLVDDQWTHARGMVGVAGTTEGPQSMDQIPKYMEKLLAIDLVRQNRVRHRVKQIVKDPIVAEKLQAWYPTWCKRPCFHDEYLETFNRDNVTLLDTSGQGLERLTTDSIVANGTPYPVDLIILATGFRAPFLGTPAEKGNMIILGRDGVSMTDEWARNGPTTLHGVIDHNFPNLFLSGSWQAGLSGNNTFTTDSLGQHVAHIIAEADRRAKGKDCIVSATKAGVEDWAMQVLMHAAPMAAMAGCTPGYFNVEGELDRVPAEGQMRLAQSGLWGWGIEDFLARLEDWRKTGEMKGIEIQV